MEKVQNLKSSNTAPSSKTFRDELKKDVEQGLSCETMRGHLSLSIPIACARDVVILFLFQLKHFGRRWT
jgi:hypothetical protein